MEIDIDMFEFLIKEIENQQYVSIFLLIIYRLKIS